MSNLTGRRYGHLVVTKKLKSLFNGYHALYSCICDCGTVVRASNSDLQRKNKRNSCGCQNVEYRPRKATDSYEPKTDCQSYIAKRKNCNALCDLVCAKQRECSFYKAR